MKNSVDRFDLGVGEYVENYTAERDSYRKQLLPRWVFLAYG